MLTYSYTSFLLSAMRDTLLQCHSHCHGQSHYVFFATSTSICSGTYHAETGTGTGRAKGIGVMIHAHTQWNTLDCIYCHKYK